MKLEEFLEWYGVACVIGMSIIGVIVIGYAALTEFPYLLFVIGAPLFLVGIIAPIIGGAGMFVLYTVDKLRSKVIK